ncbi:MAG: hypothetical protein KAG95_07195, partial [Bacteroidales bacterium]|nr:hypothetical protein [Bacteroidales bacterium]
MLQKIKFSNYLLFAFIGIILPVIFVPTSFDPVLFPRLLALSIINLLLVVYYIFISKSQTKRSL